MAEIAAQHRHGHAAAVGDQIAKGHHAEDGQQPVAQPHAHQPGLQHGQQIHQGEARQGAPDADASADEHEAPGQQLLGKYEKIKCQAYRAPKQQQETPRGITANDRAVAVEGGYHGLGSTARIRNCLPRSGHAHGFDKYSCTSRG